MEQFTLNLNKDRQRPTITLKSWNDVVALLDTGAIFPVWADDEELLKELGGKPLNIQAPVSGFGGRVPGNVYELELLQLGKLTYPGFQLVACALPDAYHQLILPATMFSNLIYEIDDKNHKLNVTIPDDESNVRNLIIKSNNGRFHVLCNSETE